MWAVCSPDRRAVICPVPDEQTISLDKFISSGKQSIYLTSWARISWTCSIMLISVVSVLPHKTNFLTWNFFSRKQRLFLPVFAVCPFYTVSLLRVGAKSYTPIYEVWLFSVLYLKYITWAITLAYISCFLKNLILYHKHFPSYYTIFIKVFQLFYWWTFSCWDYILSYVPRNGIIETKGVNRFRTLIKVIINCLTK